MTRRESSSQTIDNILEFWQKARIPTKQKTRAIPQLERLIKKYECLKKSIDRQTAKDKENQKSFKKQLDKLFDISHANALNIMTIEEDKKFLVAQRDGLIGYMAGIDKALTCKEERACKKQITEKQRLEKERERHTTTSELTAHNFDRDSTDSTNLSDLEVDETYKPSKDHLAKEKPTEHGKRKKFANIVTPKICSVLDRTKISDRNAAMVIGTTLHSLGADLNKVACSRSAVRRTRSKHRAENAKKIKENFKPDVPLLVHWDGKLLPELSRVSKVDRLTILVSGDGVEKLLGVPKIERGTGDLIGKAVATTLTEWNVADQVIGMVFDTTSSNTGYKRGACKVLQNELGRDLVEFACRHHICEVLISDVFFTCFGKSTCGPEVMLFKRFKTFWPSIRREEISSSMEDMNMKMKLDGPQKALKEDAIKFARQIEKTKKIRDDYREFVELSLIFLGEVPVRGLKVRAPGAMHHARWMAKILYCFKIYFFRKQFTLRQSELSSIVKFNLFTSLIYLKMWIQAPLAISAPENDVSTLKIINGYKEHDQKVAEAAMKALLRHLWYLSEDVAGICLFSDNLTVLEKVEVLQAMENTPKQTKGRKMNLEKREIEHLKLANFVSSRSKELIDKLLPNSTFLSKNPSEWPEDAEYQLAKRRAKALSVVNDLAERGVALMQDFNFTATKKESEKQYLLQVVEMNRKQLSSDKKKILKKFLES